MKLYYLPGACSLASHIALIWSGVDYELEPLSYETVHGDEFMALNPKGAVPTMVIGRASEAPFVLTESLAILLHIAAQNPAARLGATEGDPFEQARMHEIMAELVSEVHKAFVPAFVPDRFVIDSAAEDGARAAAFKMVEKAFRRLDGYLVGKDWLALDRRTVADAYLHVMSRWLENTPTPLPHFPNIARHFEKMLHDEGVKRALSEEGLPAD
jgi:glutathione S-transferase